MKLFLLFIHSFSTIGIAVQNFEVRANEYSDSIAGQMSALKGGSTKPRKAVDNSEDEDDESATDEEESDTSATNTDTEDES